MRNSRCEPPFEDPDDDFNGIVSFYGPHGPRPTVRARWGLFLVQFEVGFDDDMLLRARWMLLDEITDWMACSLSADDVTITATSHASVVTALIGGIEVTASFVFYGSWFKALREQVYALVVSAVATDPWNAITWVD